MVDRESARIIYAIKTLSNKLPMIAVKLSLQLARDIKRIMWIFIYKKTKLQNDQGLDLSYEHLSQQKGKRCRNQLCCI